MTAQHILTIGYIPQNCGSLLITSGDPEGSGTYEVNLYLDDETGVLECDQTDIVLKPKNTDLFNPHSTLWTDIVKSYANHLGDGELKLNPALLGNCWCLFQEEADDTKGILSVAGPEDFGEFSNDGGKYNGLFYVRYQYEEDDDFFNEQVVVFK